MQQDITQVVAADIQFPDRMINQVGKDVQRTVSTGLNSGTRADALGKYLRQMRPTLDIGIVPDQVKVIPDKLAIERIGVNSAAQDDDQSYRYYLVTVAHCCAFSLSCNGAGYS